MAKGKKTTSIICCSFEIFDIAELVEESLYQLVAALLRYILDKHFLPHFLLRSHYIRQDNTGHSKRINRDIASMSDHRSHRQGIQYYINQFLPTPGL